MQQEDKQQVLQSIFGTGAAKSSERNRTEVLDEIFGRKVETKPDAEPATEQSMPVEREEGAIRPTSDRVQPNETMQDASRFVGTAARIYREEPFVTDADREYLQQEWAAGRHPAAWVRRRPEYHELIASGYPEEEAMRVMTQQLVHGEKDIVGNMPDRRSGAEVVADRVVLPSGTVLRRDVQRADVNHDPGTFYEAVVAPTVDEYQAEAEKRWAQKMGTDSGKRTFASEALGALGRTVFGPNRNYASNLARQLGEARAEKGPERVIRDVMEHIDPEAVQEYVASHLPQDRDFAAAMEELKQATAGAGSELPTDAEVRKMTAGMSEAERKEYDRRVDEVQKQLGTVQQKLAKAAEPAGRRIAGELFEGISERLVDRFAAENMPKNTLEALLRTAYEASLPGMIFEAGVEKAAGGEGLHRQIMARAMEKYDPSLLTTAAGEALGLLAGTPVFGAGGAIGRVGAAGLRKAAEKVVARQLVGRGLAQEAAGKVAGRLAAANLGLRAGEAALASGAALGTYDAATAPFVPTAEGEVSEWSDVLKSAGKGFATGAVIGPLGIATGALSRKAVTKIGRYAAQAGGFAAENAAFVGMGTLYRGLETGEWGTAEDLAEDFGKSVGVLSIMKSMGHLRAARERKPDFYNEVLSETEFTPEEQDALSRAGVDGGSYKRAIFDLLNARDTNADRQASRDAAEVIRAHYDDVMRSPEVPMSAKAKLLYLVEGRIPERLPLVTDAKLYEDGEGRAVVDMLDPAGNLVQRRAFEYEDDAEAFMQRSEAVRKANKVHYYENAVEEMQARRAIEEAARIVAEERGASAEGLVDEVLRAQRGEAHDKEAAAAVVERARGIRAEEGDIAQMLETGVEIKYGLGEGELFEALRRREADRTPGQQAAVEEYASRLQEFIGSQREPAGAEPSAPAAGAILEALTPEQTRVEQVVRQAEQRIDEAKNIADGVVYEATTKGNEVVQIINGRVAFDPGTGEVDYAASDATVVVGYPDGSRRQISIRDLDSINEAIPVQDAIAEVRAAAASAVASAEDEAAEVPERTFVRLSDGSSGVVDGRNEDGSYRFVSMDEAGQLVQRNVAAEEIAEVEDVMARMEASADPARQLELTPENWDAEFGEDGVVKNGKLLYRNDGVLQSEQDRLPASATTPLTDIADVESKDTTFVADPQAVAPEIPRQKNGAPDYNAMPAEMLAVELSGALGHDRAIERLVVSRDAKAKEAEKVRRALETTGDLNKAMAAEERLAAMEAEEARLKAALSQLGYEEPEAKSDEPSARNFAEEIERLFQDGFPNVRARVLADIAGGQRFVWNDSPDGTKRGMAAELGFAGNESERRARFGMLGSEKSGAKHVSRYVHDLWEDSNGYGLEMDDAALRDEVIDVLLTTPSRASAMEKLRDMAARAAEDPNAPRDAEDLEAMRAYEQERRALREMETAPAAPGEEDVPFSIADTRKGAPEGVDAERYEAIVDQLRRTVGADHVVTDPAAVRAKYAEIVARDETERARQVEAANARFNEQLERLTPENADSTILDVGAPSPVMLAVGMPDRPLRLYGNKLLAKAAKHGYDSIDLRNLPEAIEQPVALFKGRYDGAFAILTELRIGADNALATVDVNKGSELNVNILTSVYGKGRDRIARWIEAGKMLYADKKKVLDYLIPPAPMAGDPNNAGLSSEKIVDRTGPSAPIADAALNRRSSAAKVVTNFENPKIEPENKPLEGLAYFRTKQGEVYGFTVDGTIYLDGERMNAEAPMHEYTELWSQIVERENPRWWARAKEIMQNDSGRLGEIWNEVNDDRNYRDLSEDLRASETLSRASAEWFARQQAGIKENEGLFDALRRVVREFWRKLKSALTEMWGDDALRRMRSDDVIGAPVKDFTDGIDLRKYRKDRADAHKWAQMEIINRHNPMTDDVHAGIRTVDDIKSFDQIVEEARKEGADIYPDMNMDLFDDAARTGKITVYSSYPIRQGVFVSPSRMNAEDYAGGGKVYSKTVAVNDVAWIAPDQGQYARVGGQNGTDARFYRPEDTERIEIRRRAQADGSWMKAPNGKPSNLDERQWVDVRTKAFKEWFGDWENDSEESSKVVDENGEPRVVYHGTPYIWEINKFDTSKGASWFAADSAYADRYRGHGWKRVVSRRYGVYLNIKHPCRVGHTDRTVWEGGIDELSNVTGIEASTLTEIAESVAEKWGEKIDYVPMWKIVNKPEFADTLREYGYDGIMANEIGGRSSSATGIIEYYGGAPTFAVIESNQVKSATNNRGSFSAGNNDIRFMREDMPFTERRVTTLERLENRRAELLADRENIANFEDRLRAVDDAIAEYEATDHVAATMSEGAESDAHLRAVEDAVYDIQRTLNIYDSQIAVARNVEDLVSACEAEGFARNEVIDDKGSAAGGVNMGHNIVVRSDSVFDMRNALSTVLHERAHFLTNLLIPEEELYEAGVETGIDYINDRLRRRSEIYVVDPSSPSSIANGVNEMISRDIEILTRDGLIGEYLASEAATTERISEYMKIHAVPEPLAKLVVEQCENIKADRYGRPRTRQAQNIQDRAGSSRQSNRTIQQSYNGRYGKDRRLGDILDKREGADGEVSVGRDERRRGPQEGRPGVRNIERPRFPFTSEDSVSKRSKQEQLIDRLRQAIRDERNDVRIAVKLVGRTLRRQLGRELVDAMGKRDFDNIVRRIEEATVRRDADLPLRKIAETVLDLEIKRKRDAVEKLLDLRVQGETSRGVSIAANVDDQTREFFETIRDNRTRPAEEVAAMLEEKGGSIDAKMGAALLDNYQAAQRYEAEIAEIGKEIEALRKSSMQLRRQRIAANKEGRREDANALQAEINRNSEEIEALDAERVRTKELQSMQLSIVAGDLADAAGRGREIHREWLKEREEHKAQIAKWAFRDIGDGKQIPILDRQPGVWEKGMNRMKDFFLEPAYSLNYLLKMVSVNAPKGEGALYDYFMRGTYGYVESRARYYLGYESFKAALDAKAREIFGKSYKEVLAESGRPTEASIEIRSGKAKEVYAPTIGEALYVYMADKMEDGRVKLRKMGIGESEVAMLADLLPQQYVRFADWLQNEFLPDRRKTYNETHLEVFGTQMAEIENYVPLRIQKSNIYEEVDGTKTDIADLPSAITGSIIRRRRNTLTIDLHTNALDLMLDHGQQMERWNAFTRVVQDMNTLLSNTTLRRMLNDRNPGLHKKLKVTAQIAADSYSPETNATNRTWVALGKLAASSKIAFRINTALKQVLSYPAFYAYSADPKFWTLLTKNLSPTTWGRNFRWCLENVSSFRERWMGRMAGNEKLAQLSAPQLDRWIAKMGEWGMFPNSLVDAVTCANGAKAVYEYKAEYYRSRGYAEADAERRARIDAALAINETQQSGEGMFLSRVQVERDFWSVSISTFQNSNFAYLRKQLEGIDELRRDAARERRTRVSYYKEQGMSDRQADAAALRDVVMAKREAVGNILTFMFVMNVLWGIGNNAWKYVFAEDGASGAREDMLQSALVSTVRNTSVGSIVESVAAGHDMNPSVLLSDLAGFIGKVQRIVEQNDPKSWDRTAAYIALQIVSANGVGIDMNTFVSMYEGVAGMIRDGADVEDVMLLLNAPRSQARLIASELKAGESLEDYQRRVGYIERRIRANVDKKQLGKWARNYVAYRRAEMLGMEAVRDVQGRVTVPELEALDTEYDAVLQEAGLTRGGNDRTDAPQLTSAQQEKFDGGFAERVFEIAELQKSLDADVVFNEAYAERLRQLLDMKRAVIAEWEK